MWYGRCGTEHVCISDAIAFLPFIGVDALAAGRICPSEGEEMERVSRPGWLILGAALMAAIFGFFFAQAQNVGFQNDKVHLALSATSGYRLGELDWNIAGDENSQNPDIRSELEFEDIEIFELGTS